VAEPLGSVRRVQLLGLFNALMYDAGVLDDDAPSTPFPTGPDGLTWYDPDSDPLSAPFPEEFR